ncbi:DUF1700 domain-containing protein [Paenibacillus sp. IHBB 10380]|uniref:DUF1700 domain-containing protein n=1 Tax=Paenibacillus sp. IHBB 10380 TaxID=1566358 RepID=UPI0005CFB12B|nr:DUF1700 domain-containing protein [Paenibacillus sp. IHBB 10380]AJS58537.1 membrane protein [Paenibacillus sp. IHBB 10380]
MDKIMNDYLVKIEKYLKSMSDSERIDIVKEIKSVMLELQNNGVSSEQIIERLGNPKELAKAYLGEAISKNSKFSWRKFGAVFAFCSSFAGVSGMFLLPFISTLSIALMISGVIAPIGGIIKFVGYLMGYDIAGITIEIGAFTANRPMEFLPISIVMGVLMFWLGRVLWKLTIKYIHAVSQKIKKMEI